MEKMAVVVFDDEKSAYKGSRALKALDSEGSISVYAVAVVKRNSDGSLTALTFDDDFPIRTATGTAIGALIGLLGGPIGVAIGGSVGVLAGSMADLGKAGVNADYLDQVSTKLTPGKWAVVSDISEEWETPVDTKMHELGGSVFRESRETFEDEQFGRTEAKLDAEIAQLEQEEDQESREDRAKTQAKIDALKAKLNANKRQARERSEQRKLEMDTKVHALEEKARKSRSDTKAKIEARIASLRKKQEKPAQQQQQQQQQPVQTQVQQQ